MEEITAFKLSRINYNNLQSNSRPIFHFKDKEIRSKKQRDKQICSRSHKKKTKNKQKQTTESTSTYKLSGEVEKTRRENKNWFQKQNMRNKKNALKPNKLEKL